MAEIVKPDESVDLRVNGINVGKVVDVEVVGYFDKPESFAVVVVFCMICGLMGWHYFLAFTDTGFCFLSYLLDPMAECGAGKMLGR